jgi:hypothetical protein
MPHVLFIYHCAAGRKLSFKIAFVKTDFQIDCQGLPKHGAVGGSWQSSV